MCLNARQPLPEELKALVLARLDDPVRDVRHAAVLAAGVLRLREAIPRLIATAGAGPTGSGLRVQAITALCLMPDPRARALYRQAAAEADPALRRAAESALASLGGPADRQVVRAAGAGAGPRPPDTRALGRFALTHLSDPLKGEELFFTRQELDCGRCHRAAGRGAAAPGPDLSGLGARYDRAAIIQILLQPPARVADAHHTVQGPAKTLTPLEFTDLIGFLEKQKHSDMSTQPMHADAPRDAGKRE